MKKLIYITGIASVNLMLFGALFKVLHLSGAGVLLTISILLFCLVFLPSALRSSYLSQDGRKYKWLYIITFVVFAFDIIGALFKILHWPGSEILLIIGIPLPFVLFLPVYLYQTHKYKDKSVINSLGIMFGLTFLAIFSVFLSLNISWGFMNSVALNSFNNENTTKFYQNISNTSTDNDIVKQKSDKLCALIDDLKYEILVATDNQQLANNKLANYSPISTINRSSSNLPIFKSINGGNESKVDLLIKMIGEFGEIISRSDKVSNELKQLSSSLFDVSNKTVERNNGFQTINWQERELPAANLIITLDVLSRIQSNVRFVESEYLSSL